jgi:GntR family transcriptional regulator
MDPKWDDNQPIYRQLRDRIAELLLDRSLQDGDALPSVREVAGQYQVNPLTVLKAYQLLVDQGLVESRRGRGMFVVDGACAKLLTQRRTEFLKDEWPRLVELVDRLGLDWGDLLKVAKAGQKGSKK